MHVLVFGAGGVGLGFASALLSADARVDLVAREATVRALAEGGLRRTGLFGAHHAAPGSFRAASELGALPGPAADVVLVCTKSFDTEAVARTLAGPVPAVGPETRFVLCQNGWGNAERFAGWHPAERIFNARVITGFRRLAPNHVEITVHAEPVRIGSLWTTHTREIEPLCAAIERGGIPCEPTRDVAADLWAKMLYNGSLNPLGALLRVPYGALAESPATRAILADLAHETFAVMQAAGHRTHWPSADAWLADFHAKLLPPTARHESSTLQDLRAGRRTEIDALTGAVVSLGRAHDVPTPVSETLLRLVQFAEAGGSGGSSGASR